MAAQIHRLTGDDWQEWANRLLAIHYGPLEYQQIPDTDRGDAGLEGFTRTDGHAFQAYGCESVTTAERYEKQRDKMTRDVGKFIKNQPVLKRLLGSVRITKWALFVPYCDSKELIAHAAAKTDEVRAAALPYAHDSFHVCVCQQCDFVLADRQLVNSAARRLSIPVDARTPQQVAEWTEANEGLSGVLAEKLERLPTLTSEALRRNFHAQVLDWYLKGQELLEALRLYPDTYAKVTEAKSQRESYLVTAMISGAAPQSILIQAINDLRTTLEREVGELHPYSSETLAHEAVADWLLRCPLDFPEVVSG